MIRVRMRRFVLPLMLYSIVSGLSAQTPSSSPQSAGTKEMVNRLDRIYSGIAPLRFKYKSSERAELARKELAKEEDRLQQLGYKIALARELVFAGDTAEAIVHFQDVLAAITVPGFRANPAELKMLYEWEATCHLRLAEQTNCLGNHNADSCLMPIAGGGVHTVPEHSRNAVEAYTRLLNAVDDSLEYKWLLNLAYMTLGEYPQNVPERWLIAPEIFESDYDIKRFFDVAPNVGIHVVALSGGVVADDFDRDGFIDLMISSWGLRDQLRLFHSTGTGTFVERTDEAGLTGLTSGLNLCHADYDNDGWVDVLVLRGAWLDEFGSHPNSLLRNNGDGTFSDVTRRSGLLSYHPTQTAVWLDYDNDGWLDLFIGNESSREHVHKCELFHNNGDGTFTDVASQVGLDHVGFVKGVTAGDYNNDGLVDLYLSRWGQTNVLYRNDGASEGDSPAETASSWRFTDVSIEAGVTKPRNSFPTWFFDYDNDGWLDIFVASFSSFGGNALPLVVADRLGIAKTDQVSRLYHNNGDGTFTDVSAQVGLNHAALAMGANYGDLDNDGFLDIYLGTGQPKYTTLVPNRMFHNVKGVRFEDVTTSGGFGHLQKGHGIAFVDLDNDGDQDIYAVMGGAFQGDVFPDVLFENPGHGNKWITLRLEGVQSNRSAIGARIKVKVQAPNGPRDIHVTVGTGGSFGSSSLQQEIGLGDALKIIAPQVTWPGGRTQVFRDVEMNLVYGLREGAAQLRSIPIKVLDFSPEGQAPGQGAHDHQSQ